MFCIGNKKFIIRDRNFKCLFFCLVNKNVTFFALLTKYSLFVIQIADILFWWSIYEIYIYIYILHS